MPVFFMPDLISLSDLRLLQEIRRKNVVALLGSPSGLLPEAAPACQLPAGQLPAGQLPAGQLGSGQLGAGQSGDPSYDFASGNFLGVQKQRLDEIERQLLRFFDVAEKIQSVLAQHGQRLASNEALLVAHAKHLGNHDVAQGSLSGRLAGLSLLVEQLRVKVSPAPFVGTGTSTGAAPSKNGKPHTNGQCSGPVPLDMEKH
jgi:hypothetical protein